MIVMLFIMAVGTSVVSTWMLIDTTNGLPSHPTDITPDYPGGQVGLAWLIVNASVWAMFFGLS